ncbi:MAG TPA: cation transporter [Firmicutes bacterium]|nr:cation transporter [Bacillota bacterium]
MSNQSSPANHEKEQVAWVSVGAAVFLTIIKFVVGFATGSLGILSEAAHSGLDTAAALMTALAVRIAGKPADKTHNYGHGKVENFSALLETMLLLFTCFIIIKEAAARLHSGQYLVEVNAWSFAVIALSIIVDINRSHYLYKAARRYRSQALEADALHFSSDIWSSGVVLLGLLFVKLGWPAGDPLAALGVAVLVAVATLRLGKRTIEALLDTAPPGLSSRIKEAVQEIEGVQECRMVRARQAGAHAFVDIKVVLAKDMHLSAADGVLQNVEAAVQQLLPEADVMVRPLPDLKRPLTG